MRPARVLLLTVVGVDGEVDVAVRADVAVGELVQLLGDVVGAPSEAETAPGSLGAGPVALAAHSKAPTKAPTTTPMTTPLPSSSTLLDAGLVDGDVVELFPGKREAPRLVSPERPVRVRWAGLQS